MTKLETLIIDAKRVLECPQLGVVGKSRLGTAIAAAECARAAFCDEKNHLALVILGIERALESGAELRFHGFTDRAYSKITTQCASARFRKAWRDLETAKYDAEEEISEFRSLMRRAELVR